MPTQHGGSLRRLGPAVLVTALLAGGGGWWLSQRSDTASGDTLHVTEAGADSTYSGTEAPTAAATSGVVTYDRLDAPDRTVVRDASGAILATLTDGARTVVLTGPERTFDEPSSTDASLTTTSWIRLAPRAWSAGAEKSAWFREWFKAARTDRRPDLFEIAMQYVDGAPAAVDSKGRRYRGDASFGPVSASGEGRREANDFNDYLGIKWSFPDRGTDPPERIRYGSLDCSGFVRMVYGYRMGYPLLGTNKGGRGLPRRAYAIEAYGPGIKIVRDKGRTATDYEALQPGDLVFFQTEGSVSQLDHVGIYMGLDDAGQHRFISSRETVNGPTMGDVGGPSVLDDGRFFSDGWRAARRI